MHCASPNATDASGEGLDGPRTRPARAVAVSGGPDGMPRGQPAVQERIWGLALLLPFIIVVKPKVLPLPLERIVIT